MSGEGALVGEPHRGGCFGGQRPTPVSGELSELELRRAIFFASLFFSGIRSENRETESTLV